MPADDEIKDVMAEERSRGVTRKKIDVAERRKRDQVKRNLADVLASGDEIALMKILRATGLKDGTPQFENAVKAFRAHRGGR
jgi:hypothetical protein